MAAVEQHGVNILLVEDDRGDAILIQECLSEAGYSASAVTWARSLAEAAPPLVRGPRCVLLDLGLPDAGGLDAVRTVVAAVPDVPVIVLTGRHDSGGAEALAAGAQDYLVKDDVTADLLGRSIRYAVERKRAQLTREELREEQLRAAERSRLERGLLPTPLVRNGRVECSTYYRPGRDHAVLGGDFYDVVEAPNGRIRAVIGDVMGHGPDEAAIGVHLRVGWRALVLSGAPDAEILSHLAMLHAAETGGRAGFVTVCDVTFDAEAGVVSLRVAGHPAPLLCANGKTRYLDVEVGPPIGVEAMPGTVERWSATGGWPETRIEMGTGSSLVLYTDGLLDAFAAGADTASVGIEELVRAVLACSDGGGAGPSWIAALVGSAPNESADDIAVVVLTTKPPPAQ